MFKKALCVLGLAASLSVSAGVYQCKKGDVSAPCEYKAWGIGGDALYMSRGTPGIAGNFGNQGYTFDPSWGLRLEASRYFGTGNDLTVNWVYLTVSQRFIDNGGGNLENVNQANSAGAAFTQASNLNWINIELGQMLTVGEPWSIRVHGGLEVTRVADSMDAFDPGGAIAPKRDIISSNLVGVRLGGDIDYALLDTVRLYTDGALGLLYEASHRGGPIGGQNDNSGGASPISLTSTALATSFDFDIGLKRARQTAYGDLVSRVGWAGYAIVTTNGNTVTWQGLEFGGKWLGNA